MRLQKLIETRKEYRAALTRADELFTAKVKTKEAEELKLLLVLIGKYEDERYPIDLPDPVEEIKIRIGGPGVNGQRSR